MDQKEKDIFFMKKAIQEAKFAIEKNEVPVGAVIVAQENIIARAHNPIRAHTIILLIIMSSI